MLNVKQMQRNFEIFRSLIQLLINSLYIYRLDMYEGNKINDFFIRKKNYLKHLQKLKEISLKKSKDSFIADNQMINTLNDFKSKNRKFTFDERNRHILQQNSKVFDKLVDISSRTPQYLLDLRSYRKKEHHNAYFVQKNNYKIINQQNPVIVKRILSQNSPLNTKKQLEQYEEICKFKERIEKSTYFKSIDKKLRLANISNQILERKKTKRYNTQQLSNRNSPTNHQHTDNN